MSLLDAWHWLAETRGSTALRESRYMYPLWFGVGAGGRWIGFSG